jgi:hypothetical protein
MIRVGVWIGMRAQQYDTTDERGWDGAVASARVGTVQCGDDGAGVGIPRIDPTPMTGVSDA